MTTTKTKPVFISFTYNNEVRWARIEEYKSTTILMQLVAPEPNAGQYRQFNKDKISDIAKC